LDGGTKRTHIPDFAVTYRGAPAIIEVKYSEDAAKPEIVERTEIVTETLAKEGIVYRVLTEKFIRREPALTVAKLLLRGMDHDPSPNDRQAVIELLDQTPQGLEIGQIRTALSKEPVFVNSVLAMVLSGDLVIHDVGEDRDPLDLEPGFLRVCTTKECGN